MRIVSNKYSIKKRGLKSPLSSFKKQLTSQNTLQGYPNVAPLKVFESMYAIKSEYIQPVRLSDICTFGGKLGSELDIRHNVVSDIPSNWAASFGGNTRSSTSFIILPLPPAIKSTIRFFYAFFQSLTLQKRDYQDLLFRMCWKEIPHKQIFK